MQITETGSVETIDRMATAVEGLLALLTDEQRARIRYDFANEAETTSLVLHPK